MFYKKAIAFSVAAVLVLASGCNSSNKDENAANDDAIKVPVGETATNGDITIINGEKMDEPPTEEEKTTIKIGLCKGPESLSAAHLLENNETGLAYEKYSYTNYNSPEEVVSALENKEINVATLPLNEAAKLYNKTDNKYKVAMLNSMFNYCVAGKGENTTDVTKLAGKTITVAENDEIGKLVINKIIKDYNIKGCTINTVSDTSAIIKGLSDGSISLALTQEPYISEASEANPSVEMIIDLYDSWFDKNDTDIVTGCLVASNEFITANKKAFVYFMKDYDASVTITRKNIDESSQLAAKFGLAGSASAAKSSIPGCSISVKTGADMVDCASQFFNLVNSIDPSAIGGILPDKNLYYTEN